MAWRRCSPSSYIVSTTGKRLPRQEQRWMWTDQVSVKWTNAIRFSEVSDYLCFRLQIQNEYCAQQVSYPGQSGARAGFLRVLRFPLPIFILPIAPQSSSSIIWGFYNRPEVAAVPSGLSPTPVKSIISSRNKTAGAWSWPLGAKFDMRVTLPPLPEHLGMVNVAQGHLAGWGVTCWIWECLIHIVTS
jgi:hypothetical protein